MWWTPDNEFYIWREHGTAWQWTGGDELEVLDFLPECRPPLASATTSSFIAADGTMVCGRMFQNPDFQQGFCACRYDYYPVGVDNVHCDRQGLGRDEKFLPFGCPEG